MFHFFRYPYEGYAPVKYVVNPVRAVEAFLCLGCLIIAIIMIVTAYYMAVLFLVIITTISAAFLVITIIDLISNSYKNPIFWNTWTMFAMTGALCFFLCLGLLIATAVAVGASVLLIIAMIIFAITAIIFLLDAILILNALRKRRVTVCICANDKPTCPPCGQHQAQQVACGQPQQQVACGQSQQQVACGQPQLVPCGQPQFVQPQCLPCQEPEKTTVEKFIKTKTLVSSEKGGTVEEVEDEHIVEHIEMPPRPRSTTSYGGTFPVGRNEAPLPCPAALNRQQSSRYSLGRNRSCQNKPSTNASQTILASPSTRLYKGSDGKPYAADGTPLTQVQTKSNEVIYQDPNGVYYTKDGTPMVTDKETKTQVIRESSRQCVTSQGLVLKDGEWYTNDGKRVPKVTKGKDGKPRSVRGKPLNKIDTGGGRELYQSADGFLYTSEGDPIGYNANVEEETTRSYENPVEDRSEWATEPSKETSVLYKSGGMESTESKRGITSSCMIRGTSVDKVETMPKPKQHKVCSGNSMTGARVETFRSKEIVRTIENSEPSSSEFPSQTVFDQIQKGHCQFYLTDGTPLTEVVTNSGELVYETMDGEVYSGDGTLIYPRKADLQLRPTPCMICENPKKQPEPKKGVVCKSSPQYNESKSFDRLKPEEKSSRTVAVSTRMVPRSAIRSQQRQDSSKSVTMIDSQQSSFVPYQHQQPQLVCQYIQKPCKCGNMHYEPIQTIQGTVCSCAFHSMPSCPPKPVAPTVPYCRSNTMPPERKTCTGSPQSPCEKTDCSCSNCYQKNDISNTTPSTQDSSEKSHLQTISECDCETETTTSENTCSQPTSSSDPVLNKTSSSEKSTCKVTDTSKATESDSAQTSETRMVRASDIQKMNVSTPR